VTRERDDINAKAREAHAKRRAKETEDEKQIRRAKNREQAANQSEEQKQARAAANRSYPKKPRTVEQNERDLAQARRRYAADPVKPKLVAEARRVADPDAWAAQKFRQYRGRKANSLHTVMLAAVRSRAAKKGYEFALTSEWIAARCGGACELTGLPFQPEYEHSHSKNPFAASIDRKDSHKGYTPDNCRMILACLNMGLGAWGLDEVAPVWRAVLARTAGRAL
jgi:hypothetical protein